MNISHTPIRHQSKGFTIMETLIATLVFGTVLIVITTAIMQFTRVYYRGVTESNTQDVTRTITDLITQGIQFNGGTVTTTPGSPTPGSAYAFCVGNQQYSFIVGNQLTDKTPGTNQKNHVLAVNNVAGCTSSSAPQISTGRELLAPNMRIARLQVTSPGANLYKVSVRVVYGDDDLINNPTTPTATCKSATVGTQFCAVSDITTTVVKRVQ